MEGKRQEISKTHGKSEREKEIGVYVRHAVGGWGEQWVETQGSQKGSSEAWAISWEIL